MKAYILIPAKEKMSVLNNKYTFFDIIDEETGEKIANYDVLHFENIIKVYQCSIDYKLYHGRYRVRIFGDIEFDDMSVGIKGVER